MDNRQQALDAYRDGSMFGPGYVIDGDGNAVTYSSDIPSYQAGMLLSRQGDAWLRLERGVALFPAVRQAALGESERP